MRERPTRTDVTKHETEQRESCEIDLVALAPERDVVPEPRRHLARVGHAAHPGEQGRVVEIGPLVLAQADTLADPGGQQPRAEDVLHRLAEPEVAGQGEGGNQLGQPEPRVTALAASAHWLEDRNCRVKTG